VTSTSAYVVHICHICELDLVPLQGSTSRTTNSQPGSSGGTISSLAAAATYLGEEGVEAQHKLLMSLEELLDALDDSGSVDPATQHAPVVKPAAMHDAGVLSESYGIQDAVTILGEAGNAAGRTQIDFQSWQGAPHL
jgi:hypothetical protein